MIAEDDGQLLGALTYDVVGTDFEVLTLHCSRRWAGVGTSLILEARRVATELGCNRYWLVTTNDNVDALRFYQRRGFRISEIRCGAVDAARRELKPEIPLVGEYGIALRDEIELAQQLPLSADHSPEEQSDRSRPVPGNQLRPLAPTCLPLDAAAHALTRFERRDVVGKIALTP